MINSFEKDSVEVLEINNILYDILPSDISLFSDNAIQEDVHFRSKGAFAFRSKKSKSKIILTFPVPLLDPGNREQYSPEERQLFENGLKLLSQLSAYPFCFVRSSRIYSYLGVSFKTPQDYLMFGVEELKTVQDLRVPGVLFVEVTLLFHNHMNLVKDFSFLRDLKITKNKGSSGSTTTGLAHESEVFNRFMDSISGDSLIKYTSLIKELGMQDSNNSFQSSSLLPNIILKVPYIAGVDEIVISDTEDNLVLDVRDTDLTLIDYTDFKMYDRFTSAQNTFDGGTLQDFQGSDEQAIEYMKEDPNDFLYSWRAYYLRDRFMFEPEINSIQSITLSKKNIFATHHLGSSQHPYLQFMGKVPARMSISSVYNSKGSYEYNQKSTFNLFRLMLNSIDTINTLYPGANSVNFIKIKSVVNNVLGIHNFIPGECVLSASSDTGNLESFQTTFIENSMDVLTEESKVKSGKDTVISENMQRASKVLYDYYVLLQNELKGKKDIDYPFAIGLIRELTKLKLKLEVEKIGGRENPIKTGRLDSDGNPIVTNEEEVTIKTGAQFILARDAGGNSPGPQETVVTVNKNSAEFFKYTNDLSLKNPPKTEADKRELITTFLPLFPSVIADLDIRESINTYNKKKDNKDKSEKDFKGANIYYAGEKGEPIRIDEVYTFDVVANNIISGIYQTLVSRTDVGRESLKELTGETGTDTDSIAILNDTWLNSFVGDTQRDLGFEKYQSDVNVRKYLDPFFFLQTTQHLTKTDFMEAFHLLNGAAFDNLKNYINQEITEEGILDGGSEHAHRLFAELADMQEKRYAPVNDAAERRQAENLMLAGALGFGINPFAGAAALINGYLSKPGSKDSKTLGFLSSSHEGEVGSANKDNKGWSYGKYQFNSSSQGLQTFLNASPYYAKQLAGLKPETAPFANKWREIAKNDYANFEKAQDDAARIEWFEKAANKLPSSMGFKLSDRGIQEAIFSASIQHNGVVDGVLLPAGRTPGFASMTAAQQIDAIYAARARYVKGLTDPSIQPMKPGIYARYKKEAEQAKAISAGNYDVANIGPVSTGTSANNYNTNISNNNSTWSAYQKAVNSGVQGSATRTNADESPKVKTSTAASTNRTNASTSSKTEAYPRFEGKPVINQTSRVKVVKIVDTDTFIVQSANLNSGKPFPIRFLGIDAPESRKGNKGENQWWANESLAAVKKLVPLEKEILILTKNKDIYGRVIAGVFRTDGGDIGRSLIAAGHVLRSPNNTSAIVAQDNARKAGYGMWSKPDLIVTPSAFRKSHDLPEDDRMEQEKTTPDVALEQPRKEQLKQEFNSQATNRIVPLDPKYNDYQITDTFGWRTRKDKNGKSYDQFHKGIDITRKAGPGTIRNTAVLAPSSGVAYQKTSTGGGGRYVHLDLDAQGFSCRFFHLESWSSIFNGKKGAGVYVEKGAVLGYVGNSGTGTPGKNYHLHYAVAYDGIELYAWNTAPLDTIPKKVAFNPAAYIHPRAFYSASKHSKTGLNDKAGTEELVLKILGDQAMVLDTASSSSYSEMYTKEQIRGYEILSPDILPSVSVYDDKLKLSKHIDKMFTNFDHGMNLAFPIIRGYAVVGNEDDEFYFKGSTLKPANYFELPTIQEFHLSTNNDFNPLDICTFSLINPSSVSSIPPDFGLSGAANKVDNIDTQYYNVFFNDRLLLRPGMKVHIKAGYSNNPNKLHTIFNGAIKEISGRFESKMNLVCESFATELISNTIGFEKPEDMSKRKNASTGLLIGYALLEENINHFGTQLGKIRSWSSWIGSLLPSWTSETELEPGKFFDGKEDNLLGGKGRAGDFRDPENKALVSPFNMGEFLWNAWNPSRANLSQRIYTNIYSDAIEAVHDQYKSDFWARYQNLISWDSEVFYSYWAFRSSSWSVIKEMEYRHPGTLAKPLWYEERQTMFYGLKEQLYVARDLDPKFMFNAGEAVRYSDLTKPFVKTYMEERPKRLEPATGFHLLSSKLNILDNNMGFSRDFSTRINVIYYEDNYEGTSVTSDTSTEIIDLDKGISSFEIRDKTIALNGCHEQYLAWLYGIQELKKQAEMMYTGSITITGKADVRAGDYAYLEDSDRGLSGIIKIRECEHHYSHTTGFITVITPGLFVECTQFLWDSFFLQMGMASKIALIKADLTVNELITENQLAQDYYEYLKVIQGIQATSFGDYLVGAGGTGIVASVIPFLVRNMLRNSTIFGIDPLTKAFTVANSLLRDAGTYSKDLGRAALSATNAKKAEVFNKIKKSYANAIATVDGKIITNIKNATLTDRAILRAVAAASKSYSIIKNTVGPTGRIARFLSSRTAVTVIASIHNISKGVRTAFMANPIGFIVGLAVELCVGFVISKFRKLQLTHNPLLLFPINHKGKPYVSGITGFTNSGILETLISNLKSNIKQLRRASLALDSSSEDASLIASATSGTINKVVSAETSLVDAAKSLSQFLGD